MLAGRETFTRSSLAAGGHVSTMRVPSPGAVCTSARPSTVATRSTIERRTPSRSAGMAATSKPAPVVTDLDVHALALLLDADPAGDVSVAGVLHAVHGGLQRRRGQRVGDRRRAGGPTRSASGTSRTGAGSAPTASRMRARSSARRDRRDVAGPSVAAAARWSIAFRAIRAARVLASSVSARAAESSVVSTLSCTMASTWTRSTSVACSRMASEYRRTAVDCAVSTDAAARRSTTAMTSTAPLSSAVYTPSSSDGEDPDVAAEPG